MRINEYSSLEEFTSQYVGEWAPSKGHWFGLDFSFNGKEYRLHTGSMHHSTATVFPNGRTALFGLYVKSGEAKNGLSEYQLLGEYADMRELLESTVIEDVPFKTIILDETTELLGQD